MTGAQAEADFDESVFEGVAETPQADDKPQAAAEGAANAATPLSQIEETAKKIGWSAKDEWKGDPADWLDAPEFILKAVGEVLPSMRKSLEKANEEISGLKKSVKASIQHLSKARQEGYEQRGRELQAELEAAAAIGDVERRPGDHQGHRRAGKGSLRRARKNRRQAGGHPEFTAWQAPTRGSARTSR
jgi:hypothetical protein